MNAMVRAFHLTFYQADAQQASL